MRRFKRKPLPPPVARKLLEEQTKANAKLSAKTLNVNEEWSRARQNKPLNTAFDALLSMAGKRERCMYCGDSQGTDIEHFWPKSPYPRKMFRWSNMLLGCTDCGRTYKGKKFPLDAAKKPLLINPTAKDDPWQYLEFDPQTGNFAPRFNVQLQPDPKGKETVDVLGLGVREALATGHLKTYERITKIIAEAAAETQPVAATLIASLKVEDEYGLLGWCFRGTGTNEPPMSDLRQAHPAIWVACVAAYEHY